MSEIYQYSQKFQRRYFISGRGKAYHFARLILTEDYDSETNTSNIDWTLSVWADLTVVSNTTGRWTGTLRFDRIVDGQYIRIEDVTIDNEVTTSPFSEDEVNAVLLASGTLQNVPHLRTGELTLYAECIRIGRADVKVIQNLASIGTNTAGDKYSDEFDMNHTPAVNGRMAVFETDEYIFGQPYVYVDGEYVFGKAYVRSRNQWHLAK